MTTAMDSHNPMEKSKVDQDNVSPAISVLAASVVPEWPRQWKAYAALVSGFFMMFNCWGMVNAYGAFMGLYDAHLLTRSSDLQLSLVGATESFLLLLPSIFAGRLLDARRHYYLGFTGFLLLFLGYFLLSFTSHQGLKDQGNYGLVWLTSGLMAGLGMTCFFTYSSHNVIQWFPRKRYIAAGITSAGAGAGGIIYPLTFKFLVARFGFPTGVRILSSIVAGTTLIAFILGAPCKDVPRRKVGAAFQMSTWVDRQALRNRSYTLYVIAVALVYGGFYSVAFHVTEWAEVKGFGTEEDIPGGTGERPGDSGFRTFWFLTIMNGASIIGRLASALFATHLSNPIVVHTLTCFLASLLAFFFWPFAQNNSGAIAFCTLFGILGGSMLSLPASGVAYLIPDERHSHVGQWTGMMWSGVSIFALIGPLIAAALKRKYGMDAVGYWTGATMLVTTVLFAGSMYLKRKEDKRSTTSTLVGEGEKSGGQTPSSPASGCVGTIV
ncbi:MAG: hypothetical protein L6R40_004918 [Gallowayella cf. fulva]|nr:MAG: hypothetical protein L6R40_004918 [Xanthomendoza cf. fulva]